MLPGGLFRVAFAFLLMQAQMRKPAVRQFQVNTDHIHVSDGHSGGISRCRYGPMSTFLHRAPQLYKLLDITCTCIGKDGSFMGGQWWPTRCLAMPFSNLRGSSPSPWLQKA